METIIRYSTIIVLLLLSISSQAQQPTTLRGQVADEVGAVVPGAKVIVMPVGSTDARTVTSNAVGDFVIPNLPAGAYTVKVEFEGFEPFALDSLNVSSSAPLKITLKVAAVTITTDITAD
ncbi:MAG TPA: carboxypeptidase-like regulatory domain-containing protein, partial [Blastocatellia bacterium]|nr:carboxypeptidase-like regulatory domain-containing protein [Blastocatellia bacterium]